MALIAGLKRSKEKIRSMRALQAQCMSLLALLAVNPVLAAALAAAGLEVLQGFVREAERIEKREERTRRIVDRLSVQK